MFYDNLLIDIFVEEKKQLSTGPRWFFFFFLIVYCMGVCLCCHDVSREFICASMIFIHVQVLRYREIYSAVCGEISHVGRSYHTICTNYYCVYYVYYILYTLYLYTIYYILNTYILYTIYFHILCTIHTYIYYITTYNIYTIYYTYLYILCTIYYIF